jgi:hypothetical protein
MQWLSASHMLARHSPDRANAGKCERHREEQVAKGQKNNDLFISQLLFFSRQNNHDFNIQLFQPMKAQVTYHRMEKMGVILTILLTKKKTRNNAFLALFSYASVRIAHF